MNELTKVSHKEINRKWSCRIKCKKKNCYVLIQKFVCLHKFVASWTEYLVKLQDDYVLYNFI